MTTPRAAAPLRPPPTPTPTPGTAAHPSPARPARPDRRGGPLKREIWYAHSAQGTPPLDQEGGIHQEGERDHDPHPR